MANVCGGYAQRRAPERKRLLDPNVWVSRGAHCTLNAGLHVLRFSRSLRSPAGRKGTAGARARARRHIK
eukprot:2740491-Prymnesium_polylepis.2